MPTISLEMEVSNINSQSIFDKYFFDKCCYRNARFQVLTRQIFGIYIIYKLNKFIFDQCYRNFMLYFHIGKEKYFYRYLNYFIIEVNLFSKDKKTNTIVDKLFKN